ncbi:hypothetical protein TWF694_004573 [Orbilia ellipsospora]|uniref:Uncharacterized protein n=1 Tax=Orbilia ellipsospora TaxID=2528407 RepID=A0AAV9WVW3_9PEZI
MAPLWEIEQFCIKTNNSSEVCDTLFANGQMQVPLDVSIRAVKGTETYKLTDAELDTIKIVYYNNTTKELGFGFSKGWYCMVKENEYLHTLDTTSSVASSNPDQTVQVKRFWVSTKKKETADFAARVLQPDIGEDGEVTQMKITTSFASFNSHVTLTGISPINYTTDNITITTEDTSSGTYQWDVDDNGKCQKEEKWTQKTWYLSTSNYPLHKWTAWDVELDQWGGTVELRHCYAYRTHSNNLKLFFAWNKGDEFSRNVGVEVSHMDGKNRTAKAWAGIKVNRKKNAVCLCRVNFDSSAGIWGAEWDFPSCFITLWDVYGNYGVIGASYSEDRDSVVVKNTEGKSKGRTWYT